MDRRGLGRVAAVAANTYRESVRERSLVELRIAARAREAADVDQGFDPGLVQSRQQLLDGPSAVADSKNAHANRIAASRKPAQPCMFAPPLQTEC